MLLCLPQQSNSVNATAIASVVQASVEISEYEVKYLQNWVKFIKALSASDPMMAAFEEKASNLKQSVDPVTGNLIPIPCEFICSPSGTGKTTFVHRICCGKSPCLYSLFHYSCRDRRTMQKVYVPFGGVSIPLITTASDDLDMLEGIDIKTITRDNIKKSEKMDYFLSSQSMFKYAENERLKFRFVGLLVALFEEVIKRHEQNPQLTWLELEGSLTTVNYSLMTIASGALALKALRKESAMPLILVMDECSMTSNGSSNDNKRFLLTCNLCRCMDILVIFVSTDVRASRMICRQKPSGANIGNDYPEWTIGFNFCPSFDKVMLSERCAKLKDKLTSRPDLIEIVNFVQNVANDEIPFLIDMFLTKMEEFVDSAQLLDDPMMILNEIFKFCYKMFFLRKTGGFHNDYEASKFFRGQLRYT